MRRGGAKNIYLHKMRTRVGEADPALSRLLTIHFDKASIDVLEGAKTKTMNDQWSARLADERRVTVIVFPPDFP